MAKPIKVLLVEDSEDDAMLVIFALKNQGYEPYYKRVDTKKELEILLNKEKWDIVISDYSMPHFNGAEALELVQKKKLNLPFIIISGTIGEDTAVDMIKKGANDYIMKDNLKRLIGSIEREIREAKNRKHKIKVEKDLKEAYKIINKSIIVAFLWKNEKGLPVEFVTENVQKIFGYTASDLLSGGMLYEQLIHPEDLSRVADEITKYSKEKTKISFVHEPYRIITKNGNERWIEDKIEIRKDNNGKITHYQGIIEDITDRIKIMKELIESEERYRTLFNGAGEGILVTDIETKMFLYANPVICKMLGYTERELLCLSVMDIHPKESLEYVLSEFESQARGDKKLALNVPCITKNGKIFYAEINTTLLSYNNRKCNIGFFTDITEKKKAEEEIKSLSKFPSENPNPVLRINKDNILLYANNSAFSMLPGLKLQIGKPAPEVLKNAAIQAFNKKEKSDIEIICCEKIFLISAFSSGEMDYVNIYARDITERKKAEQLLKESEERYKELLELAPVGIAVHSEGKIVFLNSAGVKILGGTSIEQLMGKPISEIIHQDKLKEEKNRIKKMLSGVKNLYPVEDIYVRLDGMTINVEVTATPIFFQGKQAVQVIVMDITDRKKTELILKENERKYRELVENINDWVWITDQNCIFLYSSSKVKDILGYEAIDITGKKIYDLIPENERDNFSEKYKDIVNKKASFKRMETKYLHKDGSIKILEKSGNPFFDKKGNILGFRGIDKDITEQKNLENQLFQAQKMESIGQLAGGIAHDFNNLLMAIMSYSKLLEMKLEKDSPLKVFITEIIEVSKKAANLIQNLLVFSRKQIVNLRPLDLHDLINEIKQTILHVIREDIELKTNLTKDKIIVSADSNAINQVFLNLATNACDAMPSGGNLEIKTEIIEIDNEFIKIHGFGKLDRYALISVSDTGLGMEKQLYEKIFEPFYTTKEVGKGTGLGLSVSYGIIKQHNGFINVYSKKGEGTTFKIYLPLVNKRSGKHKIIDEDLLMLEGSETILIVEDDQVVRKSLKIILEDVGYNIIEAVDGKDALIKYNLTKDKIDIIIIDIIMPKLNGKEVYDKIKNKVPDTKFIFMSGYTTEVFKNKNISDEDINFISKPVLPDKLLKKIREVLDK